MRNLATVTYAHHSLIEGNRKGTIIGLTYTVILAILFTSLQGFEYYNCSYTITDSVFGSCFFFGTGFHGLMLVAPTSLFILLYLTYNSI
jgi:cytochrome c oxidase subunit 3